MPGSTMSAAMASQLDLLGCPRFRSLTADCLAALVRTATNGQLAWKPLIAQLVSAADDSLTLRRSLVGSAPWPAFWKSPAYAMNLKLAAEGSLRISPARVATAAAGAAKVALATMAARRPKAVQAEASLFLRNSLHELKLAATVRARWAHVLSCPPDMIEAVEGELRAAVMGCRRSLMFDAIRTLLVGWTTRERLHLDGDELRGCIFGCPGMADGLPHYVACLPLASMADEFFAPCRPGPLACLRRFGVVPPCGVRAAVLSIVYRVASRSQDRVDAPRLREFFAAALRAHGLQPFAAAPTAAAAPVACSIATAAAANAIAAIAAPTPVLVTQQCDVAPSRKASALTEA
jgi:hypothetical protein